MKPRASALLGGLIREAAVLVLVFVPLDAFMTAQLTAWRLVATVVTSGGFLLWGMFLDPGRTSNGR